MEYSFSGAEVTTLYVFQFESFDDANRFKSFIEGVYEEQGENYGLSIMAKEIFGESITSGSDFPFETRSNISQKPDNPIIENDKVVYKVLSDDKNGPSPQIYAAALQYLGLWDRTEMSFFSEYRWDCCSVYGPYFEPLVRCNIDLPAMTTPRLLLHRCPLLEPIINEPCMSVDKFEDVIDSIVEQEELDKYKDDNWRVIVEYASKYGITNIEVSLYEERVITNLIDLNKAYSKGLKSSERNNDRFMEEIRHV